MIERTRRSPAGYPVRVFPFFLAMFMIIGLLPHSVAAQEQEPPERRRGLVQSLAWSPDGSTLLVGTEKGLWFINGQNPDDLRFYTPVHQFYDFSGFSVVAAARYSPDGQIIAVNVEAGLEILDAQSLQVLGAVPGLGGLNFSGDVQFTADGQKVVWAGRYDLMIADVAAVLEGVGDGGCTITSKAGANLRSGPGTHFRRVGNLATNETAEPVVQTNIGDGYIWYGMSIDNPWPYTFVRSDAVDVSSDCHRLPILIFSEHINSAYALTRSIAIHPTRPLFVSTNFGNLFGRVSIWNLDTGLLERDIAPGYISQSRNSSSVQNVLFNQDGSMLFALWQEFDYGQYVRTYTGSSFSSGGLFFEPRADDSFFSMWDADISETGGTLAIAGTRYIRGESRNTPTPVVWMVDTETGSLLHTFDQMSGDTFNVALSPDGCCIAFASDDTISIMDVTTGQITAQIGNFSR